MCSAGEDFISQRIDWQTRYTFSAKEKDKNTGYHYFGARYYDSDVSVWLSVDPMADKYPGMSPYMYTAGDPVMLVDPNGMETIARKTDNIDWVEREDGTIYWNDDVTRRNDNDLGRGETYRGKEYRRFENIQETTYEDVRYNSDKSISSTPEARPDIDGVVTSDEALDWYHFGGGHPLTVDLNLFDFMSSNLSIEDFTKRGNNALSVNFFNNGNIHLFNSNILYRPASDETLSNVYGTIRLAIVNANKGIVRVVTREDGSFDTYNFTLLGSIIANNLRSNGNPTPFRFFGHGTGIIKLKTPVRKIDWSKYGSGTR